MSEDLIKFLTPKKVSRHGIYYKTLEEIDLFLMIRYGVSPDNYFYDFRFNEPKFIKCFTSNLNYRYGNNRIILIFPEHNQFFLLSKEKANKISGVSQILNGNFKEKAIEITFFCKELKMVMTGAKIIILNLPIESIFYEKELFLDLIP